LKRLKTKLTKYATYCTAKVLKKFKILFQNLLKKKISTSSHILLDCKAEEEISRYLPFMSAVVGVVEEGIANFSHHQGQITDICLSAFDSRLILSFKTGKKSQTTVPLSACSYGTGIPYLPRQITGSLITSWLKIPPYRASLSFKSR
jgi:hypothetical protein